MKAKRYEYIYFTIFLVSFFLVSKICDWYYAKNLNSELITQNYNKDLESEYNKLLEASNIKLESNLDLKLSKVKYRDIYDFKKKIVIYKGYNDGVKKNDAVIDNFGLVGLVSKTFKNTSEVELITSKNSNISVKVGDAYGMLEYKDGLVVKSLSNYDVVKEGDLIYTSGIGNIAANILVGKVKSISLNNTEIEKYVKVEPFSELDNLHYLFIWSNYDKSLD